MIKSQRDGYVVVVHCNGNDTFSGSLSADRHETDMGGCVIIMHLKLFLPAK